MEKIMSKTNDTLKTNDTPKLGHGMLEDHGALADSELDAVSGGKLYEALSKGTHIPNVVIEF
jgi:hypothetical protein